MKYHKSLTSDGVLKYGPAKTALMVASEFWRASSGSEYRQDVVSCYRRAKELMGLLETVSLREDVAAELAPMYRDCRDTELLRDERLSPASVVEISTRMAEAFERAAARMGEGETHAGR
jgi:hypothetical protein